MPNRAHISFLVTDWPNVMSVAVSLTNEQEKATACPLGSASAGSNGTSGWFCQSSVEYSVAEWTTWLNEELAAGAWKVITEAREGGTAGIFDSSGGMRTELIGEIANVVGPANIVFEAPTKAAQAWFVKRFGPSVNLGNIPPDEVIPLETLRLGLRGDTLREVLLGGSERIHAS